MPDEDAYILDKWATLKKWLKNYKAKYYRKNSRYCVAISVDDLIEKMEEIDKKFTKK